MGRQQYVNLVSRDIVGEARSHYWRQLPSWESWLRHLLASDSGWANYISILCLGLLGCNTGVRAEPTQRTMVR